jgi:2-alkenal reductase
MEVITVNEWYGYNASTPQPPQPRRDNRWGVRVLLAAVIMSLVLSSIAGALVGGGVAYLVVTWQAGRQSVQTAPQTGATLPPASRPVTEPATSSDGLYPVADVVDSVGPAVVTVINKMQAQTDPWGFGQVTPEASGSGVIVDPRGYIVTNHHVIENAATLTVIFQDGTNKPAEVVGHDYPFSDLAVIKVDGENYPYAVLGDSDTLRVGETVVAIGSALGDFRNTVTTGIVSAVGRSLQVDQDTVLEGLIQTDAAINHGNSGGPLVDLRGEVVGINTAIVRGSAYSGDVAEGLGFSIPSNTARYVVDELIAKGKVARPYLGVRSVTINQSLAAYYGLPVDHGIYVTEVLGDTPAAQADVQQDDIIVAIGAYTLDEDHPLINVLSHFQSGQQATLTVNRGGQELTLEVVLGERP